MHTLFSATNGDGVRLHLLSSSASIGGSVPPRTKVGGFAAPRTYEHHQLTHCVPPSRQRSKQWRRRLIPACTPIQSKPFASSTMDLGDQLNKEEGADQVTPN